MAFPYSSICYWINRLHKLPSEGFGCIVGPERVKIKWKKRVNNNNMLNGMMFFNGFPLTCAMLWNMNVFRGTQQIHTSDTRLPIAPRVMASSAMGLNLGVFEVLCQPHLQKQMQNKCIHALKAPCRILCMIVFMLIPQYMQVTHALDEPQLFWLREKPEDPQIEFHAGIIDGTGSGSLVYICGVPLT